MAKKKCPASEKKNNKKTLGPQGWDTSCISSANKQAWNFPPFFWLSIKVVSSDGVTTNFPLCTRSWHCSSSDPRNVKTSEMEWIRTATSVNYDGPQGTRCKEKETASLDWIEFCSSPEPTSISLRKEKETLQTKKIAANKKVNAANKKVNAANKKVIAANKKEQIMRAHYARGTG